MDRFGRSTPRTTAHMQRESDSLVVSGNLPRGSAYAVGRSSASLMSYGGRLVSLKTPPVTGFVTGRSSCPGSMVLDKPLTSTSLSSLASVNSQQHSLKRKSSSDGVPEDDTSYSRESLQLPSYQGGSQQPLTSIGNHPSYSAPPEPSPIPRQSFSRSSSQVRTPAATADISAAQALEVFTECYGDLMGCPFEFMLTELCSKQIIDLKQMHDLLHSRTKTNSEKRSIVLEEVHTHLLVGRIEAYKHLKTVLKESRTYAFHAENLEKREMRYSTASVRLSPRVSTRPQEPTPEELSGGFGGLSIHSPSAVATPSTGERSDQAEEFNLGKHENWLEQPMTPDDIKRVAPLFTAEQCKTTAFLLDMPHDKYLTGTGDPCEQILLAYLNTVPSGQPDTVVTDYMQDRAAFMNFLNTVDENLYFEISERFREWSQTDSVAPHPQHQAVSVPSLSSKPSTPHVSSDKKGTVAAGEKDNEFDAIEAYGHLFPECVICFQPFLAGDEKSILKCPHEFHAGCLETLKSKSTVGTVGCPLCRGRSLEPLKPQRS